MADLGTKDLDEAAMLKCLEQCGIRGKSKLRYKPGNKLAKFSGVFDTNAFLSHNNSQFVLISCLQATSDS